MKIWTNAITRSTRHKTRNVPVNHGCLRFEVHRFRCWRNFKWDHFSSSHEICLRLLVPYNEHIAECKMIYGKVFFICWIKDSIGTKLQPNKGQPATNYLTLCFVSIIRIKRTCCLNFMFSFSCIFFLKKKKKIIMINHHRCELWIHWDQTIKWTQRTNNNIIPKKPEREWQ